MCWRSSAWSRSLWAFATAPRQEIADDHRYPRVPHDVVVRWHAAAGCGQLAVAVGQEDLGAGVVPVVIGAVLSISGVVIFGRVPSILGRMLAAR
jgi:hypothetical protein